MRNSHVLRIAVITGLLVMICTFIVLDRKYVQAGTSLKDPPSQVPNSAEAHFNLAESFLKQNRYEDAIKEYKQAISLNPELALAYLGLGKCFYEQDRFLEASEQYVEALRLNPNLVEASYGLGWSYNRLGRLDEAIQVFGQLINRNSDLNVLYVAYSNLASTNKLAGHFEEAISAYRQLIIIEQQLKATKEGLAYRPSVEAYQIGLLYKKMERYEEAIQAYLQAISLSSNPDEKARTYMEIASLHETIGHK